nr:GPI inositol-deacylase isoform X2 [Ipomoea batatas]
MRIRYSPATPAPHCLSRTQSATVDEDAMWQTLENNWCFHFVHWFLNLSYVVLSSKVVRIVASNPSLVIALVASTLVCFVHPALGLFLLLLSKCSVKVTFQAKASLS